MITLLGAWGVKEDAEEFALKLSQEKENKDKDVYVVYDPDYRKWGVTTNKSGIESEQYWRSSCSKAFLTLSNKKFCNGFRFFNA